MPLAKPKKSEKRGKFLDRCMSDETMKKEFPDRDRRYAVCVKQWETKKKK